MEKQIQTRAETVPGADSRPRLFLGAAEAYPAFEEMVLATERELRLGFRVFDPSTRLRSAAAREIGTDWFDLLVHTLARGVRVELLLSDFEPIARAEMHRGTWAALRQFWAAAELAGPRARLRVHPGLHPALVGIVPRLALWPKIRKELGQRCRALNELDPDIRAARLRDMPGLLPLLEIDPETGRARPRTGWYPPHMHPATHHQKVAVADEEVLYIGGLDLDERRYDDKRHERPAEQTWHDVQVMLRGPVARKAVRHLDQLGAKIAGVTPGSPPEAGFVATVAAKRAIDWLDFGPTNVERSILDTTLARIREARKLIYIETQFLRDRRVARALAHAARDRPDLQLLMVLPAAPDKLAFDKSRKIDVRLGEYLQANCVRKLRRAFGKRAFIMSPAQPRPYASSDRDSHAGAPIIYVHAKFCIFDTDSALISSANLNGRSLKWDTEAGVWIDGDADIGAMRARAFEHWLPSDAGPEFHDPETAVEAWRRLAIRNFRSAPDQRRGFVMPYDVRPAARLGTPVPVVPDEMV